MAEIKADIDIRASQDAVWDIISDLDGEPRFWKGTKETRNISREGSLTKREITIAFRDQKCMQEVTVEPKTRIHALFTEGIIQGTKTMTLVPKDGATTLSVEWDVKLTGMMGMFTAMIKGHIKSGTEQAIESIKREAEK